MYYFDARQRKLLEDEEVGQFGDSIREYDCPGPQQR
jgi:hypothetical protein